MDIDAILRESAAYFEALEEEGFDSSAEFKSEDDDPIDPILTQLKPIGDATFTEWFTTLQGLMQDSDNLSDFRDKLTDAYPDLDAAEFKQAMIDASTVAGLKGYDDAASIEGDDDAAQFSELLGSVSSAEYPNILSIVNSHYTDGIDRLDNARLNDDGSVICVGVDGDKEVAAKITDTKISIRLLNSDAEFAAPKNTGSLKKKTCKTGLSCGGTCISKSKICARSLSMEQQKQFKDLKKRLKSGDTEAQKGIDDLRNEQQGNPSSKSQLQSEVKVETKPTSEQKFMKGQDQQFFTVDLSSIEYGESNKFDQKEIEALADSILASGGLAQPIILGQIGIDRYKVIGGAKEYYAAVRAKQKDPRKGEMVNALVIGADNIKNVRKQLSLLDSGDNSPSSGDGKSIEKDKQRFYTVDVKTIQHDRQNKFDQKEIEALADSILASGGLVRPIVLRQSGLETFDVVSGAKEYYAAVRAQKKDSRKGEMVNSMVIGRGNVDNIVKQMQLLNSSAGAK